MIDIFDKNGCFIITLIPQTEEEKEYLLKGQKLLSLEMELKEQEQTLDDTEIPSAEDKNDTSEEKPDNDYEQMLLNL